MEHCVLSISIVSYNNSADIEKLIESIEIYTDKSLPKKIYVIDNADEQNYYSQMCNKYDDLEYYHVGQNIGFGRGHNYILDKINSDYHAIVNPDILLTEDSFSKILDFMDRDSAIGMVIPKMVDQNGEMLYICRRELTKWDMFIRMVGRKVFKKRIAYHEMRDMDYTKPFEVPFGQGSFLVIRTQLLKELNGFDDNFFMYVEDADLCKRVNQVSKLMYYPGTTVIHKWEKGSHKNLKLFRYHLNSMRYYFKKWKQLKNRV